jgi:mRNA interferase RelE/StbE
VVTRPPYTVVLTPAATRALKKITDRTVTRRLVTAMEALATNPRPPGAKVLSGPDRLWRIREGAYRIIYAIKDAVLVVTVVTLGHRRDVYKSR